MQPPVHPRAEQFSDLDQAAAQDQALRIEHEDQVRHAPGDFAAELVEDDCRLGITGGHGLHHGRARELLVPTGSTGPETTGGGSLATHAPERVTRSEVLPGAALTSQVLGPIDVDDHVARLTGEAVSASHQPAVGHQTHPDAGPQCDEDEISDVAAGAMTSFGQCPSGGVVTERDGDGKLLAQAIGDGELDQVRQVRRVAHDAGGVRQSRDPEADRAEVDPTALTEFSGHRCDGGHQVVAAARTRGPPSIQHRPGGRIDAQAQHLRTADVEPREHRCSVWSGSHPDVSFPPRRSGESPAQEHPMTTVPHFIAGRRVTPQGTETTSVYNPATGERTAEVGVADAATVDDAVRSASEAWPAWRDTSLTARTSIMFDFRELLDAHRLELAELVSSEHGKVRADALGEIGRGIEVVEYACGIGAMLRGDRNEDVSSGVDTFTSRQPVGVAVGITPFNFPAMVPLWMFPVAIACGNTFVLKPSEKDPSAPVRLAELFAEAGLPDGVFNVVNGTAGTVEALLANEDVEAVSFVGSTPIARHIHETATAQGKRVQALGGAKNHMVVLPDADVGQAADAAVSAGFGSAGERCMAISVVVAVGSVADPLVEAIEKRVVDLQIGPGLSEEPMDMGPLVTAEHRNRVQGYVDRGESEGATAVVDGRGLAVDGHADGFWLGPTLFDHVTPDMTIYQDEIFGPVLCVVRVADPDEALDLVNASPYGNGTAIFTNDGGAARAFQRGVQAGMVGINVPIPVPMAYHSFGGWKDSLFGDVHVHGDEGVRFYTRYKVVTERWPDPHERGVDLGFPNPG